MSDVEEQPSDDERSNEPRVSSSEDEDSSSSSSSSSSSDSESGAEEKTKEQNAEDGADDDDDDDADSNAPAGRSPSPTPPEPSTLEKPKPPPSKPTLPKAGSAYLPPAKARMLQQQVSDKNSVQYQRLAWDALKKSINGLVNKVNVGNISIIVRELFQENLVRGRGVLAKSITQAQSFSPTFTPVYAALVAVINTRLPQTGELLLKRLIVQFRKCYRRNDKKRCMLSAKFIAHLINQNIAHEIIGLEILQLLLQENPTDDAVEVAITFLKEVGQKLAELSPRGLTVVMERLRHILHEGHIQLRTQYAVEVMMAIRKDGFKEHPSIREGLDLVEEDDQITHMLQLDGKYQTEDLLNIFREDKEFLQNEAHYMEIKQEILGSDDSDSDSDSDDSDSSDDEEESEDEDLDDAQMAEKAAQARAQGKKVDIFDKTATDIVHFRRTLYLTIQSSLDYEECAHKLLKIKTGDDEELINEMCCMIVDCCQQQRTYEKFYGLLASRFCLLKKEFMLAFEKIFVEQYETIHRRDTVMLRNTGKLFSQMLYTDALPWSTLGCIRMAEDSTSSSSRVFIKILFQDLAESMGMPKLAERLFDPSCALFFVGLFPKDNPKDTRFAINFWTAVGLGGLTDDLRDHLRFVKITAKKAEKMKDGSSSSESSSSSSSSSSSDSSGGEPRMKKKRRPSKEEVGQRRRNREESQFFQEDIQEQVREMRGGSRRPGDRRGDGPEINIKSWNDRRSGYDDGRGGRQDDYHQRNSNRDEYYNQRDEYRPRSDYKSTRDDRQQRDPRDYDPRRKEDRPRRQQSNRYGENRARNRDDDGYGERYDEHENRGLSYHRRGDRAHEQPEDEATRQHVEATRTAYGTTVDRFGMRKTTGHSLLTGERRYGGGKPRR